MLNISPSFIANLTSEASTLCRCYLITRKDGTVLSFTDHDKPIIIDGITYIPEVSFNSTNFSATNNLSADNLTLNGVLSIDHIDEMDIVNCKYDDARISIFIIDWTDPPDSLSTEPYNFLPVLGNGRIGKLEKNNIGFTADVTGRGYYLNQKIGDLTSRNCRNNLGDAKCGVNLGAFTDSYTVFAVQGRRITVSTTIQRPTGYYANGTITLTSGANIGTTLAVGLFTEVLYDNGVFPAVYRNIFELYESPFVPLSAGNTFNATAGCNKELDTCYSKFNNVVNFGGEPFVPGTDFYFNGVQGQ